MKPVYLRILLAGFLLFIMETSGFTEPCAPLQAFSNVVNFDRLSGGQMISRHDCDRDGQVDYHSIWTVVEFAAYPIACQDPHDSRHLIVPRSGYYRILADEVQVVVLPESIERPVEPPGFPSYRRRNLR